MAALLLGVDPGRQGAFALLDTEEQRVVCHDMPDTTRELHDLVAGLPLIKLAVIERPFYPPKIGTATIAKIAEGYGLLKGALQWCDIPFREVRPRDWKAKFGLGKDKGASRQKAGEMFPDDAQQWRLAKHDGRAEAALIALYGRGLRAS